MSAHPHPHGRGASGGRRELLLALGLTIAMMLVELHAGLRSGSLSLLADAGHMLTDASVLVLSFFAAWIATKPATPEKTFGYYRSEILAALVNGVALWLIVIWIVRQAIPRLAHPHPVDTATMLPVAFAGLVVNLVSSLILSRARAHNLNIEAAWLHVLSDALGSVGVIIAGLAAHFKGLWLADPLASLAISLLIAVSSWRLVGRSVNILLEGTPAHLSVPLIVEAMEDVGGVSEVHDVHVWSISTGLEAMSGHIIVDELTQGPRILAEMNRVLADEFGIVHTTFQLEPSSHDCTLSGDDDPRSPCA